MSSRASVLALGLVAWTVCGSCSLMGLGEFGLEPCVEGASGSRSPCAVLDERDGILETDCEHWQCRRDSSGGCERRPKDYDNDRRADAQVCLSLPEHELDCDDQNSARYFGKSELCDGVDNDCDGTIHEGALDQRLLEVHTIDTSVDAEDGDAEVTHLSGDANAGSLLALVRGGRAALIDLSLGAASPIAYGFSGMSLAAVGETCPVSAGASSCNFRQLGLSAAGPAMLSASVSDTAGCSNGELRLGVGRFGDDPLRLYLGGPAPSLPTNLQYGVDVRRDGGCPAPGVRNPVIAALNSGGSLQALALWLATDELGTEAACFEADASTDVRAIGVWVRDGTPDIVLGTNAGASQAVGQASSTARPALLGCLGDGIASYVAAYSGRDRALTLALFPVLPRATSAANDTRPLATPRMLTFAELGRVDRVTLVPGANCAQIGVAFRTGCGPNTAIGFAQLELRASQTNVPDVDLTASTTLSDSAGSITAGPELNYVSSGFRFDTRTRRSSGGWVISWSKRHVNDTILIAARVTEEGMQLDPTPFEVARVSEQIWATSSGANEPRISYTMVNRATSSITTATTLCSTASRGGANDGESNEAP